VDHGVLGITGEFGLGFCEEIRILLLLRFFVVLILVFAEDLDPSFRVTGNLFQVHGPDRLIDIKDMQQRPILSNNLIGALEIFLIKIATNLRLTQHYCPLYGQYLNAFFFLLVSLVK
jgi:hypothetical protein